MKSMYLVIKEALVERGWTIDQTAVENESGELHEFIHPETGCKFAYIDALLQDRELFKKTL